MKVIEYLKREGVKATVKKIGEKITLKPGADSRKTLFLVCSDFKESRRDQFPGYAFARLAEDDLDAFDEFNFFQHIKGCDYVGRADDGAVICIFEKTICAYACFEMNKVKRIHGTGQFELASDEAWIGPCYVAKEHRGRGLNGELIRTASAMAASRGARRLFTSINGANFASQASFEKAGFETFAIYDGKSKSIVATDSARFGIFENKVMIKEGTERIAL